MGNEVKISHALPQRYLHEGVHYLKFLPAFALKKRIASYFEIGVNKGKSIRLINAESVGVDPGFIIDGDVIGKKPALHLYQKTSDDFFRDIDLAHHFPKGVDLAFLDGMHLFEFLLRDFMNTEKFMAPAGTIFLHDCLPINWEMAERDRRPGKRIDTEFRSHWTGDVWKVVDILKRYRPDLTIRLFDCVPTGLVAISDFDRRSRVLNDAYDAIIAEYSAFGTDEARLKDFYDRNPTESANVYIKALAGK